MEQTFEAAFKRLEEIVALLEQGELPLDESLRVFEEGVELARYCTAKLDDAEKRINVLVKDDGGFELQPMESPE